MDYISIMIHKESPVSEEKITKENLIRREAQNESENKIKGRE